MNKIAVFLYTGLLSLSSVTGCRSDRSVGHESGKLEVTAMLPPQAALVEAIGGDSVSVNTLIGNGVNPESYEPTVAAMRDVANSSVMLLSGALGFEQSLAKRIEGNNSSIVIVDTSAGIEPIYGTHRHHDGSTCSHDHGGDVDPHTWTSIKNTRVIARNVFDALSKADPGGREYYETRYNALDARLDSMDAAITTALAPVAGSSFLVWHPSLSYFARDYDLRQITIELEGKETSPRGIKEIVDKAQNAGARVFFVQADFDTSRAESISRQTGADVVKINPLDRDWEKQMNVIVKALVSKK